MKTMVICLLLLLSTAVANAAAGPSLERGKALFENDKLGSNGKSCATCHPNGKRLEWAATFEESRLANIVNKCIEQSLKGKPLDPAADDMRSLLMYLKTFAGPGY
jgi:cytochrome c553